MLPEGEVLGEEAVCVKLVLGNTRLWRVKMIICENMLITDLNAIE